MRQIGGRVTVAAMQRIAAVPNRATDAAGETRYSGSQARRATMAIAAGGAAASCM